MTEQVRFSEQLRSAVAETEVAVNAAANGDLTRRITVEDKTGELATLSKSVNALIDVVTSLVAQIRDAAERVHGGAHEISVGNASLSQRTSEQAASRRRRRSAGGEPVHPEAGEVDERADPTLQSTDDREGRRGRHRASQAA